LRTRGGGAEGAGSSRGGSGGKEILNYMWGGGEIYPKRGREGGGGGGEGMGMPAAGKCALRTASLLFSHFILYYQ